MNILLIWPKFLPSFFSGDGIAELVGNKTVYAPLSLITVAALLPQSWSFRVTDCNVDSLTEEDWDWADMVMISGMISQKDHLIALIIEAKERGKTVASGGSYATSVPEDILAAGSDYLVLDEGEVSIPLFLEALEQGATSGTFRSDGVKADMTKSPIPRFDLLNFDRYLEMSVQYSRGCPFLCEFCDIPVFFGRRPRVKTAEQILAEFDRLLELGWRQSVFIADDNFIGDKKRAISLLNAIADWQVANEYPLSLSSEATLNMGDDPKLLEAMRQAGMKAVFVGIETPDLDSLVNIKKTQNSRRSMIDRINKTYDYGIRIVAGFILGFDGEKPGADQRIFQFIQDAAIPIVMVNMLFALPHTPLTERLDKEGRLVSKDGHSSFQGKFLSNFVLSRPLKTVAEEYINCLNLLYDPKNFLSRLHRHCLSMGEVKRRQGSKKIQLVEIKVLLTLIWRQGVKRSGRFLFWKYAFDILRKNPRSIRRYVACNAQYEHFYKYSKDIEQRIWSEYETMGAIRDEVYQPSEAMESAVKIQKIPVLAV